MQIRPVAADDFDQWLPLWDGYNTFYERHGPTALPEAITNVLWQRFFDDAEPVFGLVADDSGELLGLVNYLFHRSTTSIEMSCYLQDLFTTPQSRGQGVGRALIEGVDKAAHAAGADRVYWLTHETNEPGRILYDKVANHAGFLMYNQQLD
jgi:GNAT superfamily N-acetyltransferase